VPEVWLLMDKWPSRTVVARSGSSIMHAAADKSHVGAVVGLGCYAAVKAKARCSLVLRAGGVKRALYPERHNTLGDAHDSA
jgi:hypothetical protein